METESQDGAPLRILMAVPQYPYPVVGGLEKQAHELSSELVRQGHHVQVLSGRIDPGQPDLEVLDGVVVHRLPWPRTRQLRWIMMPLLVWRLFARLRKDTDVVHCHVFSGFGLYLILLANCARVPIMVKLPNVGLAGLPGMTRGLVGRIKGAIFRRADAVVAMSQQSLEELEQIGFDMKRVLATPNGIRILPAGMPRRPSDACFRMVFVGRLHIEKGLQDLVGALRLVEEQRPARKWTLDVIGDGDQMHSLDLAIHESGLVDRIRLLGRRDGIREYLPHYDALLLPSYGEGNSNVILEAMAAGLAVVSTRVGGTPMLLGHTGQNWLHRPGDCEGLAALVMRLLEEPEQAAAWGQALRQRVEDNFEIGVVSRTYVCAYRLLAAGRRTAVHTASNPVVPREEATRCAD